MATIHDPRITLHPSMLDQLDDKFPDEMYVLHHSPTQMYGCYSHFGIHGLAVFSSASSCSNFGQPIQLDGLVPKQVTFDEAREIAKERPMPVVAMMLLDNISDPVILYVK
jgi:hypothetical protein